VALPGNYAKEIGYAVDVLRDFWGPDQWPLENFVLDKKDKELVRQNAPIIGLEPARRPARAVSHGGFSQGPRPNYRIEHAVQGYIDIVRRRERGDRELVESPEDGKHREAAQAQMRQFTTQFERDKRRPESA
jgi:hypothetical protein